jgi:LytS/YehU family sensor histidine kinase
MDKVLYLDDEKANLTAFQASFRHDFKIITCPNGSKALEILKNEDFKIVLSDQRMPEMSGVEFFKKLSQIDDKPIRILITAFSDSQALQDGVNQGHIYYFIQKPFDFDEMKGLLYRAISDYDIREQKHALEIKVEREEKEKVKAVLHNLQNQVNPHFLFNSLNMLHALIGKDQEKSREYVIQLSDFLRKSLEYRDQDLAQLSDELELMDKYLFIQKIRFGDSLVFSQNILAGTEKQKLPVMALQICVENAIKHNIMSKGEPLKVEVFSDAMGVTVINDFNPRESGFKSTGVGHENLLSRYRLFGDNLPLFKAVEKKYIASLPYIHSRI